MKGRKKTLPKIDGIIIIGLSKDKQGLLARTPQMSNKDYWHVHSDEMTKKQRKYHRELLTA